MASPIPVAVMKEHLTTAGYVGDHSFAVAKELACFAGSHDVPHQIQEMVLRAFEQRESFGDAAVVIDGLVRELGLFPYLDPELLTQKDLIAYEFHRPLDMDPDIVFHRPQAAAYRALIAGYNVVLSAPTSFGKSLIIDAAIASGRFSNIVIIVPTIALIDETRRRLTKRFSADFRVLTHSQQEPGKRNIYILTPERALDYDLPELDLCVIDEFYKLSPEPDEGDDDRCDRLNIVFQRMRNQAKQMYLLGPQVAGVPPQLLKQAMLFQEDYHTVVSELHRVEMDPDGEEATLLTLLKSIAHEPTIVYCRSVGRAIAAANWIADGLELPTDDFCNRAAAWAGYNYDPDWHFARALRHGIGVHHGRIPRALAQLVVRAFDKERLKVIVCTSTLIEGVNTKAKHVVLLDQKRANRDIDLFTFNNIRGRSGRMNQHVIGHVWVLEPIPDGPLPGVDVPILTQPDDLSDRILVQLDEQDVSEQLRARQRELFSGRWLSSDVLRKNVGVDPVRQIVMAKTLHENVQELAPVLQWRGRPNRDQSLAVTTLIWDAFDGRNLGHFCISSAAQLAFFIKLLADRLNIADMVLKYNNRSTLDQRLQGVLDFQRQWAQFHYPMLLRALNNIQKEVLPLYGFEPGEYEHYAFEVEHLFLPPSLIALDEYGLPLQVGVKLEAQLARYETLDGALDWLRNADADELPIDRFERIMFREVQRSLTPARPQR
ncbi:MAG: DEAD/DEAH box helicase [Armatimonadota bacterium]